MSVEPVISSGGKDRLEPTADLYVNVFETDPVITYMLCSMPSKDARLAYLPGYFRILLRAAALNGATFHEIGNYECAAVLMHPGKYVDNTWTLIPSGILGCLWKLGVGGCKRMLLEYEPLTNAAKAKALRKGEKHFYVFFVGTREDCRGRGLASAITQHFQSIAAAAETPLWLEATTSHSRDIYLKLGFTIIDELVLGKGKASADGTTKRDGEGVKVWGMLWRHDPKAGVESK